MGTLAVVGGGVIGCAVAWRAAEAGWTATVYDGGQMPGAASPVAGGMLAPFSEGWPGEEAVLHFGAASLARWPEFAERLRRVSGHCVLAASGVLTVALDAADAADLRTIAEWVQAQGFPLELCDRARVRELEPSLHRAVRLGLLATGELAVDNRKLLAGLHIALGRAGAELTGLDVTDLAALPHDQIVLAAGWRTPQLWPGLPIRPVKGEVLRVAMRSGTLPGPIRVVRARVHGRSLYLVPREFGYVVGATQYESGDSEVTVAGVRDLLGDAEQLFSGIGDYRLVEAAAGLRPMTPDNLPLIGRIGDRVIVAAGHGRIGMLTTPLTVDAVLAALRGDRLVEVEAADPQRFPELQRGES
jgi:glycine oxidase